ncbi:MAG: O-antigen ligase family protein [Defluviimonas sp.]|uniref:O-antigen ligase family protein n=1 Tax=Albidovulum sp. TaxID=1872424 RepID=UPI002A2F19F8|nr:O-antigen ligase family protein [Defluviimonas sp.]
MTVAPAVRSTSAARRKSASVVALEALYDLGFATLIIIAGSQGVYRFLPPLLLWAMLYAMLALKFATNFRPLMIAVRDNIALFAYPAAALLSATWSIEPGHTLYSGMQLSVTYLMGIWLGWRYRPGAIILAILGGLAPLVALSLVNYATGMFGAVFADGGGLLGIFSNKNTLGRMAMLLALAALALMLGTRQRPLGRAALLGLLAMAGLALLLSKSATSAIVMIAAAGLFVALTMPGYRTSTRLAIALAGSLAFIGGCALLAFGDVDPVGGVLNAFGKSSNLTGRTSLWAIAGRQIDTAPWLGVGFDAYWDSGAFRAVDRIQNSFGTGLISFHDFILDVWVGTGVPGLVGIGLTIGGAAFLCLRAYLARRDVEGAAMLAFFAALIGVALFNPLLYCQHENAIVILIAFGVSSRISLARR